MLKVDINKDGSKPVVHASGNIMEILNDIAVMIPIEKIKAKSQ